MAQMFRAVKCDSKRSQSDWQEEYANRKRARIEEDRKVSQKQASGRTDEQMTVWHVDAYKLTEQVVKEMSMRLPSYVESSPRAKTISECVGKLLNTSSTYSIFSL